MASHRLRALRSFRRQHRALHLFLVVAFRLERRPPSNSASIVLTALSARNVVTNVYPASPAEQSGIEGRARSLAFDGRRVEDAADQERVLEAS